MILIIGIPIMITVYSIGNCGWITNRRVIYMAALYKGMRSPLSLNLNEIKEVYISQN